MIIILRNIIIHPIRFFNNSLWHVLLAIITIRYQKNLVLKVFIKVGGNRPSQSLGLLEVGRDGLKSVLAEIGKVR